MTTEKMRVSASSVIRSVPETRATPASGRGEFEVIVLRAECTIRPRMGRFDSVVRRVFFFAAIVWAAIIVFAPALVDAARTGGRAASAVAFAIYTGCSAICHQRPERSFQLFGHQMPVCARCTGIYAGAALAAIALAVASVRVRSRWPAVSIAFAATLPSLSTL